MRERLQKIIAGRGLFSRRQAEHLIRAGCVQVNGRVVSRLGETADPALDVVLVNGRPIPEAQPAKVLLLNKPRGYVSSCRPTRETGPGILNLAPKDRRYFPVGRLDRDSSGLILLTDDGDLALRLTHPRYGTRKVYCLRTEPDLSLAQVRALRRGVMLEDGWARPSAVTRQRDGRLRITLTEGRKREIRRMIRVVGAHVTELERIQIGGVMLGDLPAGHWRELAPEEIRGLLGNRRTGDR